MGVLLNRKNLLSLTKVICLWFLTWIFPYQNISISMTLLSTKTLGTHQHIAAPLLFSPFQKPSTITKVMEEIFRVNTNKDIKDMAICDITQDNLPILVSPKKPPVTSTILTTLSEVHSFTPPSSKYPKKKNRTPKPLIQSPTTQYPWPHKPPYNHTIQCLTKT